MLNRIVIFVFNISFLDKYQTLYKMDKKDCKTKAELLKMLADSKKKALLLNENINKNA
jgi:hypothetical protein